MNYIQVSTSQSIYAITVQIIKQTTKIIKYIVIKREQQKIYTRGKK